MRSSTSVWSRRGLCLFGGLLGLSIGESAQAQQDGFGDIDDVEGDGTGPELAVRTGYGAARGSATRRTSLQERFSGALPIAFDLGYRFHPRWFVGGYGEYALGFSSATSDSGCPDCTFTWLHLSLQVQYRFLLEDSYNLWVGLGTGRHWFNMTLDREAELTQTLSGPELFNLQFGSSFALAEGIALGPYSTLSLGTLTKGVERCGEENLCVFPRRELDLGSASAHAWFTTGVRLVFLP